MTEHVAAHLAWCQQRNLRPTYINVRRQQLALLTRTLGKPAETATEHDLELWYADTAQRLDPAALSTYLSHAAGFYRWLVRQRIRDDDPTARLEHPRLQRRLPRPIADRDLIPALINPPDRVRPWMLLGLLEGFRACEVANLRGEDINWELDAIMVTDGKGGHQRVLPLHPIVGDELDLLPRQGWLFPHWSAPGPVKPWNVSHGVNKYLHSIGVEATFHQFRHRFATDVYAQTGDLRVTQELMGHADPRTTAGYTAWNRVEATAAVRALRLPLLVPDREGEEAV